MSTPATAPDLITNLQTRLDELATQLYAALRYTTTHHPSVAPSALANTVINPPQSSFSGEKAPSPPPGQQAGQSQSQNTIQQQQQQQPPGSPNHLPQPAAAFDADLAELATDLVAKQREIEELIGQLPGDVEAARVLQEDKIRELARQMGDLEGQAERLGERRDEAGRKVEGVIGRFRRV
jgi:mediator of RNA polymerase II transcription subunit 21